MALTTSRTYYRQGFAPLMPQVVVAPYPYCLHCKVRQAHPEGDSWYKASPCTCHQQQSSHDTLISLPCFATLCADTLNASWSHRPHRRIKKRHPALWHPPRHAPVRKDSGTILKGPGR